MKTTIIIIAGRPYRPQYNKETQTYWADVERIKAFQADSVDSLLALLNARGLVSYYSPASS